MCYYPVKRDVAGLVTNMITRLQRPLVSQGRLLSVSSGKEVIVFGATLIILDPGHIPSLRQSVLFR